MKEGKKGRSLNQTLDPFICVSHLHRYTQSLPYVYLVQELSLEAAIVGLARKELTQVVEIPAELRIILHSFFCYYRFDSKVALAPTPDASLLFFASIRIPKMS